MENDARRMGDGWEERTWGPWGIAYALFRGWMRRMVASVVVVVATFSTSVLYLAFWATQFAWYQNLAVLIVIGATAMTVITGLWVSWAMQLRRRFHRFPGPW